MIDLRSLPPALRQRLWQVAVLLLLIAVVFLLGFTAGRLFEHWRYR